MQRLAITPGEPAGIGPDVVVQAAQRNFSGQLIAVCDPDLLQSRAEALGTKLSISEWHQDISPETHKPGHLWIDPVPLKFQANPGELNSKNADYVIQTLERAARGCMQGLFGAMVTAPVQKSVINDAGIAFSGHTEYLQAIAGVDKVVMMLASPQLRVALVTTHLPLRDVANAITKKNLQRTIEILHKDLVARFGIERPRIIVAGLNPHAGEGGHLGSEEIEIIKPIVDLCIERGMLLTGPLPADTLFSPAYLANTDAVLAMYHDQGLPVLKSQGFGDSVNITLGLPFIRTSVDHGTALDLAATGAAKEESLITAINMAFHMAERASSGRATTI